LAAHLGLLSCASRSYPLIRVARSPDDPLRRGAESHPIAGTAVPVFGVPKTVSDLFGYRR
jgi:hypothetical protein